MSGVDTEVNDFDWEEIFMIDFVEDSESEGEEGNEQEDYTEEGKFLLVFKTCSNFNICIKTIDT